ncbi:MAG: hypothetical protein ACLFWH_10975 [Actinomycetota bacterium]
MTGTTPQEVQKSLEALDRGTLREMVYQVAQSHIRVCELTSRVGDCAHIGRDEIRERVEDLELDQMTAILAPTAWMAVDLHRRIGT